MPKMNEEERQAYLAELHVGVVAVERAGRAPLAVPVWYSYQPGGEVLLPTHRGSVKEKLIREAGRFTFTVQSETPPYRYVSVEGPVVEYVEPTPEAAMLEVAVRYLGEEEGAKFVKENYNADLDILIKMRPERWLSTDYSKE